MIELFTLKHDVVSASKECMLIPEIMRLNADDESKEKKQFHDNIKYIYFTCCRSSPYINVPEGDRKKIVSLDYFEDEEAYIEIEKNILVKEAAEKIIRLQYDDKEMLMLGVKKKIDEYLKFWDQMEITENNHKIIADTLDQSVKLIKLRDSIESLVREEKMVKEMGGGSSKLFED